MIALIRRALVYLTLIVNSYSLLFNEHGTEQRCVRTVYNLNGFGYCCFQIRNCVQLTC